MESEREHLKVIELIGDGLEGLPVFVHDVLPSLREPLALVEGDDSHLVENMSLERRNVLKLKQLFTEVVSIDSGGGTIFSILKLQTQAIDPLQYLLGDWLALQLLELLPDVGEGFAELSITSIVLQKTATDRTVSGNIDDMVALPVISRYDVLPIEQAIEDHLEVLHLVGHFLHVSLFNRLYGLGVERKGFIVIWIALVLPFKGSKVHELHTLILSLQK